jgi:hypothetical protein
MIGLAGLARNFGDLGLDQTGIFPKPEFFGALVTLLLFFLAQEERHFCSSISRIATAWMHPLQIIFPQHVLYLLPVSIEGKGSIQIGQSSFSGGCLNSSISRNSAACLSCSSSSSCN